MDFRILNMCERHSHNAVLITLDKQICKCTNGNNGIEATLKPTHITHTQWNMFQSCKLISGTSIEFDDKFMPATSIMTYLSLTHESGFHFVTIPYLICYAGFG